MTLGVSLIIIAVGAILTWAVHPANPGSVDVQTVGIIVMVVGLIGFLLDLMLWSDWGPRYAGRRTVVVDDPAHPAAPPPRRFGPRRRTVVEEEVVEPPPGPPVP